MKALLFWHGLGNKSEAVRALEEAVSLAPDDPNLEAQLEELKGIDWTYSEKASKRKFRKDAEDHYLRAMDILSEVKKNIKKYDSNLAWKAAPVDVELGLKYIDRALKYFPDDAAYLNTKALLLWEGLGRKRQALPLLKRAVRMEPDNITYQDNLVELKRETCFVATAAFGTPLAQEVETLRAWRDRRLLKNSLGIRLVEVYYFVSPPVASYIEGSPVAMKAARLFLRPLLFLVKEDIGGQNDPKHPLAENKAIVSQIVV